MTFTTRSPLKTFTSNFQPTFFGGESCKHEANEWVNFEKQISLQFSHDLFKKKSKNIGKSLGEFPGNSMVNFPQTSRGFFGGLNFRPKTPPPKPVLRMACCICRLLAFCSVRKPTWTTQKRKESVELGGSSYCGWFRNPKQPTTVWMVLKPCKSWGYMGKTTNLMCGAGFLNPQQ